MLGNSDCANVSLLPVTLSAGRAFLAVSLYVSAHVIATHCVTMGAGNAVLRSTGVTKPGVERRDADLDDTDVDDSGTLLVGELLTTLVLPILVVVDVLAGDVTVIGTVVVVVVVLDVVVGVVGVGVFVVAAAAVVVVVVVVDAVVVLCHLLVVFTGPLVVMIGLLAGEVEVGYRCDDVGQLAGGSDVSDGGVLGGAEPVHKCQTDAQTDCNVSERKWYAEISLVTLRSFLTELHSMQGGLVARKVSVRLFFCLSVSQSVCLSVCLSDKHVDCDKREEKSLQIFYTARKII